MNGEAVGMPLPATLPVWRAGKWARAGEGRRTPLLPLTSGRQLDLTADHCQCIDSVASLRSRAGRRRSRERTACGPGCEEAHSLRLLRGRCRRESYRVYQPSDVDDDHGWDPLANPSFV
jgi:hypothetical protein